MKANLPINEVPMKFEFSTRSMMEPHFHDYMELVYVFEGKVTIRVDHDQYCLYPDDFIIINSYKSHIYLCEEPMLIGTFAVSRSLLSGMMSQNNISFWCNSSIDRSEAYEEVRGVIKELVRDFYETTGTIKIHRIGQYYELLYLLTRHFLISSQDTYSQIDNETEEKRIEKITAYVMENYKDKISLNALAEQLFLSESYLSKYIKKHFGMNFLEFVNNTRLNQALSDLLYTEHSITRIAIENGFSNTATFNRVFRQKYQKSPKAFLQEINGLNRSIDEREIMVELKDRVEAYIAANPYSKVVEDKKQRQIVIELTDDRILVEKSWRHMLNVGTAADLLKSNIRDHVLSLKEQLGFTHIRIWDLYSAEMYIDINAKNHYYNFEKLNRVLDFIVINGLFPYLELNVKPKKLLRSVENTLISDSGTLKFDSLSNAEHFIKALLIHLLDRYPKDQLNQWYFELWKEEADEKRGYRADIVDTPDHYLELFDVFANTIRSYLPKAKIGGGGLSIRYGREKLMDMLKLWHDQHEQPDFISFYSYPYVLGDIGERKINKTSTDRNYLSNYISTAEEVLIETGFENTPLHISEWNSTVSNRNILNDGCNKGAFIMKNLIDNINKAELIGYWFASDVFADFYDSDQLLSGSSGLITKDGIYKPAYYAMYFMNKLGHYLVAKGDDYLVTDTGYHEYRLVCHNHKFFNHRYFNIREDEIGLESRESLYEDLDDKQLDFSITVKESGFYEVKIHSINQQYGSVQDEWYRMSCPKNLVHDDIQYLKQMSVPRISIRRIESEDGTLRISTVLKANEIQFIEIKYKYQG